MKAIYAFSGDPITLGHIDVVRRAARTYDHVLVAIGENPNKRGNYLLSVAERLELAKTCLREFANVSCAAFEGLLGEYAYRHGFDVIIRGVRNNSDLEGELVQFAVNETIHPSVDTVFFPTRRHLSHISSGVVKAIVAEGGDVSAYCPLCVKETVEMKILGKFTVGVAGGIAAGKTLIAKKLVAKLNRSITASYVSLDDIGHQVLADQGSPIYHNTRRQIANEFGQNLLLADGAIDRKALGKIVFSDRAALAKLNSIMHEPMMTCLYQQTRELPIGVIVIEGAILVEAKWTNLVNNNVIIVDADESIRLRRLLDRQGIEEHEALTKIHRQITNDRRRAIMEKRIGKHNWGRIWYIDNNDVEPDVSVIVREIADLATGIQK